MTETEISILFLFSFVLYHFIIHPAFISSLSQIPNAHWSAPYSNLWIKWQRYRGRANRAIHAAHTRLGPVLRLGASEISVNSAECVKVVYSNDAFEKDEWYARAFANYGVHNMFSTTKKVPHTIRKRILAALYSKTTLYASPEIRDISNHVVAQRLLPIIEKAARDQEPLDVLELSLSFAMDFITSYLFGVVNCSDFLQDAGARRQWLDAHGRTKGYGFWRLELPGLNSFLERSGVRLVPPAVAASAEEVRQLCLHLMQKVDVSSSATLPVPDAGDTPVVYQHLSRALGPSSMGKGEDGEGGSSPLSESADELRLTVASELMDHIKAGTETSGWTLAYLLHEMSQRPELQESLRKEVLLVLEPGSVPHYRSPQARRGEQSVENVPSARALDTLPLLNAIILETLRLHPAVPGSQPRITPPREKSTFSLAGYTNIPPGVRVGAQAYSLHRNHDVFPRPESWNPERWLVTDPRQKAEMMLWFWPFGSGSRMCIGNHFALLELKLVVAAIYTNYTTEILDDEGIGMIDGYSAGPVARRILMQFKKV